MKCITVFFVSFMLFHGFALAQNPSDLKQGANQDANMANRLMAEAIRVAQENPSTEGYKTAISLFVQAGQLFERAGAVYQSLVPQYATPQDVNNAAMAMQYCIDSVNELKRKIGA